MKPSKPAVSFSRSFRVACWTLCFIFLAYLGLTLWINLQAQREEARIATAESWCEATQRAISIDPRFVGVRLGLPKRYYAFSSPSWFISVYGVVIDDSTDSELRSRIDELRPPGEVSWQVINCRGDYDLLKALSGAPPPPSN